MTRDWKEEWVDEMGLIVALDGQERFDTISGFKYRMAFLDQDKRDELMECLRKRFTPSSVRTSDPRFDGCKSAAEAVESCCGHVIQS